MPASHTCRRRLLYLLLHTIATPTSSTRLALGRPSAAQMLALAKASSERPFNHGEAFFFSSRPEGQGVSPPPKGSWKYIAIQQELGQGEETYKTAQEALSFWRMHEDSPTAGITIVGNSVITFAKSAPRLWSVNPCRMTHTTMEARRSRVGYATLQGHLIAGCETMDVVWDGTAKGPVVFQLESISRGSGLIGRAVFPFIARTQRRFFQEQADTMKRICWGGGHGGE